MICAIYIYINMINDYANHYIKNIQILWYVKYRNMKNVKCKEICENYKRCEIQRKKYWWINIDLLKYGLFFSHTREISMFVPESSSAFQKFTGYVISNMNFQFFIIIFILINKIEILSNSLETANFVTWIFLIQVDFWKAAWIHWSTSCGSRRRKGRYYTKYYFLNICQVVWNIKLYFQN